MLSEKINGKYVVGDSDEINGQYFVGEQIVGVCKMGVGPWTNL